MKLMAHLYFGDISKESSLQRAVTILDSGADILEIGIPYSDPVCDGEIFQRACKNALAHGITPMDVFDGITSIRTKDYDQSLYLTSYIAPIFAMGEEKFVREAKKRGVTGLIVPDMLLEEQQTIRMLCRQYGLSYIQFATIYSSPERLSQIASVSTDFVYTIAFAGVTGEKRTYVSSLASVVKHLKSKNQTVFVGFGIQSASDVEKIKEIGADGIIVGSAIAKKSSLVSAARLVKALKAATIKP